MIISGQIELQAARARMQTPRAAFRKAMHRTPSGVPGYDTLLELADLVASNPETPAEARIAWNDVTVFIRTHPDIGTWAPVIGLNDADLDALFRLAMEIDSEDS